MEWKFLIWRSLWDEIPWFYQNHGIGYAKGGTFLIKEFNQKIVSKNFDKRSNAIRFAGFAFEKLRAASSKQTAHPSLPRGARKLVRFVVSPLQIWIAALDSYLVFMVLIFDPHLRHVKCFIRHRSVQKKCRRHFFSAGWSGYAAKGNRLARRAVRGGTLRGFNSPPACNCRLSFMIKSCAESGALPAAGRCGHRPLRTL